MSLVADKIKNLKIAWTDAKRLEVSYDAARIFRFHNFWHSRKVDGFSYVVEIRLAPNKESQLGVL